jgi:signal transduction histidine kinase
MPSRSLVYSLAIACTYGLTAGVYIVVSSSLAADTSASVEEMQAIETTKGIVFVVLTTVVTFVAALVALRRMQADGEELARRERALVANESRAFAGVMAASVAHDANNVLYAVLADLEELARRTSSADADGLLRLRTSVERLMALNRRMVGSARHGVLRDRGSVDLRRLVREAVATVRSHTTVRHCRVVCHSDEPIVVDTSPLLVHQIVSNLVLNAAEATGGKGAIEVDLRRGGDAFVLAVHDDGPGIPPERRSRLWESFDDPEQASCGLGLFSVHICAQSLGGTVRAGASHLGGALFEVRLPAMAPEPAPVA